MPKKGQGQPPKLSVTHDAEKILIRALDQINAGYLGGKINKMDLASWAILESLEELTELKIDKIRKRYFNELLYLETVLKLSRESGQERLAPEHLAILQSHLRSDRLRAKPTKDTDASERKSDPSDAEERAKD